VGGQLLEGVAEDDLSRARLRRIPPGVRWLKNRAGAVGQNRMTVGSLIFLVGIVLFCFLGPLLYRTNETHTNLLLANQAPSARHVLGTSPAGFDELGQLMVGGQSTLEVGFAVAVLASSFGLMWGLVAGYMGGWVDAVMMRIVDGLLSVPFLFFVVVLAAIVQPTLPLTIVVLSAASWLSTARLVRGESLSLRTREYVEAARVSGARASRLMVRHIAPNLLGTVMVNATLKVADAILAFAAMSYLGLGPPAPATNWGLIVTNGINNIFDGYWWQLWPAGLLIVATALAVNILGDGMRDLVEKRHQQG
jgi:ABC-type dipeptide/oligopeptide/nickel transport system permease subunit